ncbi:MAG: hypothetical protein U0Z75_09080 [Deinococcaceae bacterium]
MDYQIILETLNRILTNKKISEDLISDLNLTSNEAIDIEVESEILQIEEGWKIDIISKVIQQNYFPIFFCVRIILAIGGVEYQKNGIVVPKYCFCELNYNQDLELSSTYYYTHL